MLKLTIEVSQRIKENLEIESRLLGVGVGEFLRQAAASFVVQNQIVRDIGSYIDEGATISGFHIFVSTTDTTGATKLFAVDPVTRPAESAVTYLGDNTIQ